MLHQSEKVFQDQATARKRRNRKVAIGSTLAAVLIIPAGAYAAVTIFGKGSLTAEAYQSQGLTVSEEKLSKKLFPGAEADLTMKVTNPNPFPVKVTQVEPTGNPTNVTAGCDLSKVSGPVGANPAYSIPVAAQQTVPGGGDAVVTIPKAVKLDLSATQGCGFTIAIKITGTQSAAGN
jgi:hypothetical protein